MSAVPDYLATEVGERYISYELRRHLSAAHYLPPGLSYLVATEDLSGFHQAAHRGPRNRLLARPAGWLRVRRLRRARRGGSQP